MTIVVETKVIETIEVNNKEIVELITPQIEVAEIGIQGPEGAKGDGAGEVTHISGANLSALRIVCINKTDGKAYYADKDTIEHAQNVLGITKNSALINEPVSVVFESFIEDNSWNWNTSGNQGLYLGSNGALVQGAPSGLFTQKVGFVVSATKAFIRIYQSILN